jgi:hypothetical protein
MRSLLRKALLVSLVAVSALTAVNQIPISILISIPISILISKLLFLLLYPGLLLSSLITRGHARTVLGLAVGFVANLVVCKAPRSN